MTEKVTKTYLEWIHQAESEISALLSWYPDPIRDYMKIRHIGYAIIFGVTGLVVGFLVGILL